MPDPTVPLPCHENGYSFCYWLLKMGKTFLWPKVVDLMPWRLKKLSVSCHLSNVSDLPEVIMHLRMLPKMTGSTPNLQKGTSMVCNLLFTSTVIIFNVKLEITNSKTGQM